ncbi:hypothetical protein ACC759_38235, partial [Rhizobium ruizarguesonis]
RVRDGNGKLCLLAYECVYDPQSFYNRIPKYYRIQALPVRSDDLDFLRSCRQLECLFGRDDGVKKKGRAKLAPTFLDLSLTA